MFRVGLISPISNASATLWLAQWFKVSVVVVLNPLENSSFCFTNVITITRCFRTCPKIKYIMCSNLVLTLILKHQLRLLPVEETCTFILLGKNLFIVFSTDLMTCSNWLNDLFSFSSLIWYHKNMFFVIMFFNYCLVTCLRGFIFVWDITISHCTSLFSFYLFK